MLQAMFTTGSAYTLPIGVTALIGWHVLQIVSATASMYGCNSSIAWNPIEYIPVVNSKEAVDVVKGIAGNMSAIKQFQELDRPTFMAEDVAFFNGRHATQHMSVTGLRLLKSSMLEQSRRSCKQNHGERECQEEQGGNRLHLVAYI